MTRLATEVAESSPKPQRPSILDRARSPAAITLYCYLLLAIFVTSRLWLNPGFRSQGGDPDDVNQATWFMRYAATAISHFRLPALITTTMNAPHGVNLMWNTSILLPASVMTPFTLISGPQFSLNLLLVIGFVGSAAAMFYVLRRWDASVLAAALGGGLYGFSPALINSGIGHYSLVLGMLPPLILDRLMRIVTGRGGVLRNGLWLGALAAAQIFISEEALVDAVIAAVIMLIVLALSRPRQVLGRIPPTIAGLAIGGVLALIVCARALYDQFHGIAAKSATATVVIQYNGHLTNLGTLPYVFINPASSVLLHSSGSEILANHYPQPIPEYLAYLGVPLIIVLLFSIVYFWRNVTIRVAGLTCIALEWLSMGAKPILPYVHTLPAALLPWRYIQHLPIISGMVPDRLCVLADALAAVVLAYALDLARSGKVRFLNNWQNGAAIATGVAVIALLPLVPTPYGVSNVSALPAGWRATFDTLHLPSDAPVMLAPYPWAGTSQVIRWQAVSGQPGTMIGGDFIQPGVPGRAGRAGRAGLNAVGIYLNDLYAYKLSAPAPSQAQIRYDMSIMKPAAVVAVTKEYSPMGQYLIELFGQPTTHFGNVLSWRLRPGHELAPGY